MNLSEFLGRMALVSPIIIANLPKIGVPLDTKLDVLWSGILNDVYIVENGLTVDVIDDLRKHMNRTVDGYAWTKEGVMIFLEVENEI